MGNTLQTPLSQTQQNNTNNRDSPSSSAAAAEEEIFQDAIGESNPNEQFTCEICIEPTLNKFTNTNKCSHPYCTDCIVKYIRVRLQDDNNGNIHCPASNCTHSLDPFSCAPLIGQQLFVRWCDILCEDAILQWDKCYCPYRECNELVLNECGGAERKSKCPKCKKWFCFECRMAWHAGFGCEESGELREREDVEFGRVAEEKKWKRCPKCKHFVELRDGCQIVKCRCGVSFCYRCGKQVHQHWCRCDTTSVCLGWCFRLMMVLAVMTLAFFFFVWHLKNKLHKST